MFASGEVETVTRIRPPERDRHGDPVVGSSVEKDIHGCLYAPGSSSEDNTNAAQVDTGGTVYAPAGTEADVSAHDRLRIRGDLFEVVGDPQAWGFDGTVIRVRRVTG